MEGLYTSSASLKESESYETVRRAILNDKRSIGICSLSETNDHALMWAHYADQYSGICIEYSLPQLLSNLPNGVDFVRMFYDEHGPTVPRSSKSPDVLAKMVLSYKNYRWLYEREWRMFADHQGEVSYVKQNCATHVYLGSRVKKPKKDKLEAALKSLEILTTPMTIQRYSIKFD